MDTIKEAKPVHELQDISYTLSDLVQSHRKCNTLTIKMRLEKIIFKLLDEMDKIAEKI